MRECNPQAAGVLGPVFEAVARLKSMTPLDKDPVRQMGAWSYFVSGIIGLNNLAGGFPALRPYVAALEAGETIRASLQTRFSRTMRRVSGLKADDGRAITRIMEVEDAEGRLATENADGTATITPSQNLVGSKAGEVLTLSKELNEVRREMRSAIDDMYTYMIQATKAAMGYLPGDKVPPEDQKVLDLMEKFRRKGYIPHIRPGSWGVQYKLNGVQHFETFSFDPGRGTKASGRAQALDRISELKKMGATDVTPPLDIKSRREMIDRYLPQLSSISKMDILFQSLLSRPPRGDKKAAEEVRKIFDMLRKEAAAKNPRLRERKGDPGWLTQANYDTYLRSMFSPFIASASDWVANTATRGDREKAIADLGKVDQKLQAIAQTGENYLHSDEGLVAQLKSLAFFYTLGGNISSALVNLTQPMHTSLPFLGGVGGAGNAARQLIRAYKDTGVTLQRKLNFDEILNPEKLPADVRDMVKEMFRRGVAEALLTRDQAPASLSATTSKAMYSIGRGAGKVLEASSYAFSAVEQVNRVAVAIAAFRMAQDPANLKTFQKLGKNLGRDIRDATDAAEFAIRETQFVTSKAFRGRYMHGIPGGIGLQFMSFPIYMLGFMNRAARYYGGDGIFKSPEGRKTLGLLALGLFATAGLWGMPFVGPAGDMLDWLSRQLGPSLGMSPIQTRIFLRDTLKDAFKEVPSLGFVGTPAELADMVMYGPFRATGIDISKRTALDIIQFNPFQFDIFDFGPLGGAVLGGVRDAQNYMAKGEDLMAIASLLPLAARNVARAKVMGESGFITPGKFEPVLPASKVSDFPTAALVATGFRPTKVSEAAEARRDTEEIASALDSARSSYSDKIATATVKSLQARSAEDRRRYLKEAQDLRREVAEYDRGRPLLKRIVRDPASFQSSIQEKIKKLRQPQRLEAVPPAARPYYSERLREGFQEGGSIPSPQEIPDMADKDMVNLAAPS